ncbi:MAG: glutathione S-transferase, partial [Pseudomonadota bacterium]
GADPTEADWFDPADLPGTLSDLLDEIGRTYVPVMLANARAIDQGIDEVNTEVEGARWIQQPFPYQARCLSWLRASYVSLDDEDRTMVDDILAPSGCGQLFEKP